MNQMEIDPTNYSTIEKFKRAVYEKHGIGSWLDDLRLSVYYRKANNIELPDYLKEILSELEES